MQNSTCAWQARDDVYYVYLTFFFLTKKLPLSTLSYSTVYDKLQVCLVFSSNIFHLILKY